MKPIQLTALAIAFFSVIGISCGPSLKVSSDYDKAADFSKYKTFSFYHLQTTGSVSQLNATRIHNAIEAEMKAKGFTETEDNPDLLVNAVTQLKDQQQVTANSTYYGYGGMYRPYGYWGGGVGMGSGTTTYNTYNYKTGTFTIDIVDNKNQKLVWQGVGSADIDSAPKDPDAAVKNGVNKLMANFPPGSAKK